MLSAAMMTRDFGMTKAGLAEEKKYGEDRQDSSGPRS
jgi:hypothetical protein